MYILYIVLIPLSFAGIIFVLAAKIHQIKTGKTGALGRLSIFADPPLRRYIEKIKLFFYKFNSDNVGKVFTFVSHNLFHAFGTAGLFLSKHHKRLTGRLNGQRKLRAGGVVSFFLKNVSESKGEDEKKP